MIILDQETYNKLRLLERQYISSFNVKLSDKKSYNSSNKITMDKSLILYSLLPTYPLIIFSIMKIIGL